MNRRHVAGEFAGESLVPICENVSIFIVLPIVKHLSHIQVKWVLRFRCQIQDVCGLIVDFIMVILVFGLSKNIDKCQLITSVSQLQARELTTQAIYPYLLAFDPGLVA